MYANRIMPRKAPGLGAWYNELLTAGTSIVTQYQSIEAQKQAAKAAADYQASLVAQQAQQQQQPVGTMGSQNLMYYALAGVAVLAVVFMMTKSKYA